MGNKKSRTFSEKRIPKSGFSAYQRKCSKKKGFFIDFINGYQDHVHCLGSLNSELSVGKIAQLIKGESSFWINKNNLTRTKFEWSDEFFAVGVGREKLNMVRSYIANQEEHHAKHTFEEEYQEFVKWYEKYTDSHG